MRCIYFMLCLLIMLSACSTADTNGSSTTRDYDLEIVNHGSGDLTLVTYAPIHASTEGQTDQQPTNSARNETSPGTSLGMNGGTSSLAASGAEQLLDGIASSLRQWQDYRKRDSENSTVKNTDSNNTTDNSVKTQQPVLHNVSPDLPPKSSAQVPDDTHVPTKGKHAKTYDMAWQSGHNRPFTWLDSTGVDYGAPLRFVFNNGCGELVVVNPSDDFNKGQPAAPIYFCGTKNKPEESNGNRASIFGPTGCHADKVTVSY